MINDGEPINYSNDFMMIKFDSHDDDDLSVGITLDILGMIIVTASMSEKNGKYYT